MNNKLKLEIQRLRDVVTIPLQSVSNLGDAIREHDLLTNPVERWTLYNEDKLVITEKKTLYIL